MQEIVAIGIIVAILCVNFIIVKDMKEGGKIVQSVGEFLK